MLKWMLAAGAAALAITAPALADPKGGGKGQSAQKAERGGGQAKARSGKGQQAKVDRGGGGQQIRANRGGGGQQVRAERSGGKSQAVRTQRSGGSQQAKADRGNQQIRANRSGDSVRSQPVRFSQSDNRTRGGGRDNVKIEARGGDRARGPDGVKAVRVDNDAFRGKGNARIAAVDGDNIVRVRDVDRRGVVRVRDVDRDDLFVRRLGYGVGGCPPGLAKKPVACMPPGQAAKWVGQPLVAATRFGALEPLPRSFNNLFWDNDDYYYRYGGGYVYRVDRDDALIAAMIPLFGAALIGQPLQPSYLNPYYQPSYFNAFYPNSSYDCYRYGYSYIYETDCRTGLVEDVIPTYGYGYGVGQLLPASYGYYNLPYTYRSYYVDNDDYFYRYAPGAIYQVDRDTALISAVVSLLASGLTVGQPLPIGYSAYNVPLAYRTTYYDTPNAWYRYNDGYIYAVDPGTRMVRSVAYTIV